MVQKFNYVLVFGIYAVWGFPQKQQQRLHDQLYLEDKITFYLPYPPIPSCLLYTCLITIYIGVLFLATDIIDDSS